MLYYTHAASHTAAPSRARLYAYRVTCRYRDHRAGFERRSRGAFKRKSEGSRCAPYFGYTPNLHRDDALRGREQRHASRDDDKFQQLRHDERLLPVFKSCLLERCRIIACAISAKTPRRPWDECLAHGLLLHAEWLFALYDDGRCQATGAHRVHRDKRVSVTALCGSRGIRRWWHGEGSLLLLSAIRR